MDAFVVTGDGPVVARRARSRASAPERLTAREVEQLENARKTLGQFETRIAQMLGEGPESRWSLFEVSRGIRLLVQGGR